MRGIKGGVPTSGATNDAVERGGLGQEESRAEEKSVASKAYPLGLLTLPAASSTVLRSHN